MIYYLIHVFAIDNLLTTHRMSSMVRQHSGMSSLPLHAASLNSGFYWQINCAHRPQGLNKRLECNDPNEVDIVKVVHCHHLQVGSRSIVPSFQCL